MTDSSFSCYLVSALSENEFLFACRTLDAIVAGQLVLPTTQVPHLALRVDGYETRLKFSNLLVHTGMIALRAEMDMWDDWAFISFCTRWHAINEALADQELKESGLIFTAASGKTDVEDAVYRVAARAQLDNDGKLAIPELIHQCRSLMAGNTSAPT
ncbi:hypothetical protein [Thiobacillus denitrificans]|uniref:hypothetical protein n=1 Tax=Thiobacillus denitrificans TaxID=36861 RepID=UPI00036833ED|nr:hypothetical protein [Thiobacillus denitrificans]